MKAAAAFFACLGLALALAAGGRAAAQQAATPPAGQTTAAPTGTGLPPAADGAAAAPAAPAATAAAPTPATATPPVTPPAATTKTDSAKTTPSKSKGASKDKKDAKAPAKPVKPPPPPPKPPLPNKALLKLKPFAGSWTCTGHTFGPGPDHATAATMTFTWGPDAFWLEAHYDEQRGVPTNTVPVSSSSLWVFDDLQAGVSALTVDNIGGSASELAPDWVGNKLVFEGPGHRFSTQFVDRDTYVLQDDTRFTHTQEANVNETWLKLHEDSCVRTATTH